MSSPRSAPIRRLVTVALVAALPGCIIAPPFFGGSTPPPLVGGWLADQSTATFMRWGQRCGYRVVGGSIELTRGDERLLLLDLVQPDGLLLSAGPGEATVEFSLGDGRVVAWDNDAVAVGGAWYEFGRPEPVRLPSTERLFEGQLGPQGVFTRGQVWMSADGGDLELHRSAWKMVLRDAVPPAGVRFTVDSFQLPRVRFELANGAQVLWVRDRIWVDGALVAEQGRSPVVAR